MKTFKRGKNSVAHMTITTKNNWHKILCDAFVVDLLLKNLSLFFSYREFFFLIVLLGSIIALYWFFFLDSHKSQRREKKLFVRHTPYTYVYVSHRNKLILVCKMNGFSMYVIVRTNAHILFCSISFCIAHT